MAQPTPYNRLYDFTQYALDHPSAPYNPSEHDAELDAIEQTVDDLCANIAQIQRDDGGLFNGIVTPDSFSNASLLLIGAGTTTGSWLPRGNWATATSYALRDFVNNGGQSYVCAVAHTSGTFATDLAAGKWVLCSATGLASSLLAQDANVQITGSADDTKVARFEVDGFTAGQTRVFTLPDRSSTVATLDGDQTFTGSLTLTGSALSISATARTIGANYQETRNVGVAPAGSTSFMATTCAFSGDAGGTTDGRMYAQTLTITGSNNIGSARLRRAIVSVGTTAGTLTNAFVEQSSFAHSGAGAITSAIGYDSFASVSSTGSIASFLAYRASAPTMSSSGTITSVVGLDINNLGNTLITNAYGVRIVDFTNSTNMRGVYLTLSAGANKYNIYADGTAQNYFAGRIGLGVLPLSSAALVISGSTLMTGGTTAYGVRNSSTIQSDVTTTAYGNNTSLSTQATAFTLTALFHYGAGQGTIGAGSTVTNQYGFIAESTLTGATNNYGFFGNIASGSGRYNLYMNGTADNYLAGRVGVGTTPNAATAILVGGSTLMTGATTVHGFRNNSTVLSDVTTQANGFLSDFSTQATPFTLTALQHFTASQGTIGAGSTVTNQYGFIVASTLTGATNNYGFYGNIASGSNRWNLYMAGTASNYLAGKLGLGQTVLTTYGLRNSLALTGGTSFDSIVADGIVQSDVTSNATMFLSAAGTLAAAFTLNDLQHFRAHQGTIGAASAITTQTGFHAASSLTGATSNYGFRGLIAAGSGRYNLYMDGTAQNYLAGVTGIGVVPSSTTNLVCAASTTGVSSLRIPHGTTPSAPVDGDVWTTSLGLYIRINGATVGPLT